MRMYPKFLFFDILFVNNLSVQLKETDQKSRGINFRDGISRSIAIYWVSEMTHQSLWNSRDYDIICPLLFPFLNLAVILTVPERRCARHQGVNISLQAISVAMQNIFKGDLVSIVQLKALARAFKAKSI